MSRVIIISDGIRTYLCNGASGVRDMLGHPPRRVVSRTMLSKCLSAICRFNEHIRYHRFANWRLLAKRKQQYLVVITTLQRQLLVSVKYRFPVVNLWHGIKNNKTSLKLVQQREYNHIWYATWTPYFEYIYINIDGAYIIHKITHGLEHANYFRLKHQWMHYMSTNTSWGYTFTNDRLLSTIALIESIHLPRYKGSLSIRSFPRQC